MKKTGSETRFTKCYRLQMSITIYTLLALLCIQSIIYRTSLGQQAQHPPTSGGSNSIMMKPNQIQPHKISSSDRDETLMAVNELIPPLIGGQPFLKTLAAGKSNSNSSSSTSKASNQDCPNGLLTFELSTGFIYKPASAEMLAMVPSTLQLTDCLNSCLQNSSCLAINFEMGLCVLLSSSAQQNPKSLYSSQFPVFTIYAEKKCLLSSPSGETKNRNKKRQCQRAWTFERVAGYEMRTKPRRRLRLANKELCMEACLTSVDFDCRSANWYRQTGECTLSDQDRHSISQAEAGDQRIKTQVLYGPSNLTQQQQLLKPLVQVGRPPNPPLGLYQNYYTGAGLSERSRPPAALAGKFNKSARHLSDELDQLRHPAAIKYNLISNESSSLPSSSSSSSSDSNGLDFDWSTQSQSVASLENGGGYVVDLPANALVDYLENNCIYEPNKLCEFRKIQNKILKTVDSIYQDVGSLEECKQKCLNAPYRCYSFDYGDTSERVCRTSHLDQASLMSVKDPYLEVVGAITYELASCFNVTIHCGAREMIAQVSSNKLFRGKIYVKSRPTSCQNDVNESLQFELAMKYHDDACDVRSGSNQDRGVFSNDIIIQHHDRIVTTQDVGLSVYCQYDLGNRSITNNVDLAIERIDEPLAAAGSSMESKTPNSSSRPSLTITSLATTVVRSPNVTMRITNMNGQPVSSATVGDRLALLFEIKEKTSPFGIFVREIIAMDGKQMLKANSNNNSVGELVESFYEANKANAVTFIDSQGCPTDANIMGPLQKMDPAGQRILAPFDAFKFPTSDMVFFRAVVSSCVSECKPVICGPSGPQTTITALDFDLSSSQIQHQLQQQQTSGVSSVEPPGMSHLMASTRNMQPARSTEPIYPTTGSIMDAVSTVAAATTATSSSTSTSPWPTPTAPQQISSNDSASGGSADSMTTTPGFTTSSYDEQALKQEQLVATNVANNHQIGRVPSRPIQLNSTNSSRPDFPAAPLDLTLLTSQQKQQLVKLFEQRLRSPPSKNIKETGNSSSGGEEQLSEMADLYAGFLTSIMLNGAVGSADANSIISLVDLNETMPTNGEQTKRAAQLISGQPEKDTLMDRLENFLAYLLARLSKRTGHDKQVASSATVGDDRPSALAEILSILNDPQALGSALIAQKGGKTVANTSLNMQNQGNHNDHSLVNSSGQLQQPEQHFDGSNGVQASDLSSTLGNQEMSEAAPSTSARSSMASSSHNSDNNSNHVSGDLPAGSRLQTDWDKRKRFTSYGRRRRRSIRQPDNRDEEDHYVRELVSQTHNSHYIDPIDGQAHPFRLAIVEMYHTAEGGSGRVKREAKRADLEQQAPQLQEELVVQSIKIVDRLHFSEDESAQPTTPTPNSRLIKSSGRQPGQFAPQQQSNRKRTVGPDSIEDQLTGDKAAKWSSLSLIIVGMLFVFAQTILVLICLLDWSSPAADKSKTGRRARPPVVDCSTMSSRCASAHSVAPSSVYWPEDSVRLGALPVNDHGFVPAGYRQHCPDRPLSSASEPLVVPLGSYDRLDSYLLHNNNIIQSGDTFKGDYSTAILNNKLYPTIDMPDRHLGWTRRQDGPPRSIK